MTLAALPPLLWALAGLIVVARFSGVREPRVEESPRIGVNQTRNLQSAA